MLYVQNHFYLYPNIANARKGKFTQAALAEHMGICQQEISRYETGEVKAPVNYLIDLANICNVSVDYILGHSTDISTIDKRERYILSLFNSLTEVNKIKIEERMITLIETQK